MAPAPVVFLIIIFGLAKGTYFRWFSFAPHAVRLVFLAVPFVVVIVAFVVVFVVRRLEMGWRERYRDNQRGAHQGCC